MTTEAFGAWVRERREAQRLSRRDLAQRSGVSSGALDKLEGKDPPTPRRATAIDMARGLTKVVAEVNEAIALLGYEPMTTAEIEALPVIEDPKAQLDRMWPDLPTSQQVAVVALVAAMVHPQSSPTRLTLAADDPAGMVVVQEVTPGAGTTPRPGTRSRPRDATS